MSLNLINSHNLINGKIKLEFSEMKIREGVNPIDNSIRFEIFNNHPVSAAYSWGKPPSIKEPLNYSTLKKFSDPDFKSIRTFEFLKKNHIGDLASFVSINPIYPPDPMNQILYITRDLMPQLELSENSFETNSNFVWTKEKRLALGVKPADCVAYCFYGINDKSESVLGVGHLSYHLIDLNLGYDSVKTLASDGVDPTEIKVAIGPTISMDNYSFPVSDKELIRNESNWHGGIENRGDRLFLNILHAAVGQFLSAGVLPENIEIIKSNTFDAAKNRDSFSDRYAKSKKEEDPSYKDGRIIFAASLN